MMAALSRIKEKKIYLILLLVLCAYIIFLTNTFDNEDAVYMKNNIGESNYITRELCEGDILRQEFTVPHDNLTSVSIRIGTFMRTNYCENNVKIYDKQDNVLIYDQNMICSEVPDSEFYQLSFDEQNNSKNRVYEIVITGIDGSVGNAVCFYMAGETKTYLEGLTYNGEQDPSSLHMQYTFNNQSMILLRNIAIVLLIVISVVCLLVCDRADEKSFLIIACAFGLLHVFCNPFCHLIDESTHFFRSFAISEGEWFDEINENNQIGAVVSENYGSYVSQPLTIKTFFKDVSFWMDKFSKEEAFYVNPYMCSVIPINHAIGALGISIARLIGLPAVGVIIFSRLINLVAYIAICYLAIKRMKYYKTVVFGISLLPMSMWLAGSCSQDPILNAMSILFVSICFSYFFERNEEGSVSKKDMILLLISGISIASVKYMTYTPLLLFFFFIPKKKFNKKTYIGMIISACVIIFVSLLGQVILLDKFPYKEDRNGNVDVILQIKYMIENIYDAIKVFATYVGQRCVWHWASYYYHSVSQVCYFSSVFFITLLPMISQDKYVDVRTKEDKRFDAVNIFAIVCICALVMFSLYVGYTPIGDLSIDGVQTRYAIPILLPIAVLLGKVKLKNEIKNFEGLCCFITILSLTDAVFGMLRDSFLYY